VKYDGQGERFLYLLKAAVDDMETQRLAIQKVRARLLEFDSGQDLDDIIGHDVGTVEEKITWPIFETDD